MPLTDKQLADLAEAHFRQTASTSYRSWVKAGSPKGTHWWAGFDALSKIGITATPVAVAYGIGSYGTGVYT
jgi:hypothetical protein